MADDPYARIAQLEAEVAALREREAALVQKNGVLATERAETLEQQTVTAEVLRVIAASPTALDRVLTVVAESAARLCEIDDVVIFGIQKEHVVRIASVGTMLSPPPSTLIPLNRQTIQGRAIIDRCPVHLPDVQAVMDAEYPVSAPLSRRHGTRSALAVPLIREGAAVGAIYARRDQIRPFTDQQISLLETFADQAVIAIENARLFSELEQRNADLQESNRQVTEALEQQTATAEVLQVIARSPIDQQQVLDTIVRSVTRLCQAENAVIYRREGSMLR